MGDGPRSTDHGPRGDFGPRLRALRTARGMSIPELAAAAGLHPQTVQQLELGMSSEPRRPTLAALARALRLSDAQLADLVRAK